MRIETRGLTRRFGRIDALRDISLDIPSGRRIGLVGPNGSGKSTLTRVFVGLLDYQGEVLLDGLAPRRDRDALARQIAYVPQVAPNLAAPVGELVSAVVRLRGLPATRVKSLAGDLDLDVEALWKKPFRRLSGGMKQKLLIAFALATDASCLILDEPTASLDALARERFFHLFERVRESRTVVLCSHRLEEMRHLIDHVVALEDGRARYVGPADVFLEAHALCTIQALERGEFAGSWLRGLGFHPGAGGWWQKTVDQSEKISLLPRLASALGDRIENLHVRDLETIALEHKDTDP